MDSRSSVKNVRSADWPSQLARKHVGNVRDLPRLLVRLIYFDQRCSTELFEHLASASPGRTMLAELTKQADLPSFDPAGIPPEHDRRAILSALIAAADDDLNVGGAIDLHLPADRSRRASWEEVHPDQVIAIRGAVAAAKDVQPSSLRLDIGATSVRVYVQRDHFLHLNQGYLTGLRITVVGKVRSVPRAEMYAAAIGTIPMPAGTQQGSPP